MWKLKISLYIRELRDGEKISFDDIVWILYLVMFENGLFLDFLVIWYNKYFLFVYLS